MSKKQITTICPTILAEEIHGFHVQMKRLQPFAKRIHIDLMDGIFASPRSLSIDEVSWPANIVTDLHIMYTQPFAYTDSLVAMQPQLIIVHAEAEGDFTTFAETCHHHGIETGVALLPETKVDTIAEALALIDHVLVFSGHLGHFGGQANLNLLNKAKTLRQLKPTLEIGWDGGVSANNAKQLAECIDVLNVGGFIQHAQSPLEAYKQLQQALST